MRRKRISVSPATAIATLALFFALGGGSAFAVSESGSASEQRTVGRAKSAHSFDEALEAAARSVPRAQRKNRLTVTYQIKASNPHIAEFWAILTTG